MLVGGLAARTFDLVLYLSRRAGCFCRQAAGSLNVLDTLAYVIICNHWSATRIYDVLMNQGVSTEDNRGLTSYSMVKVTGSEA
jgi:hypothetical protein